MLSQRFVGDCALNVGPSSLATALLVCSIEDRGRFIARFKEKAGAETGIPADK
jgi:hypothetical protein